MTGAFPARPLVPRPQLPPALAAGSAQLMVSAGHWAGGPFCRMEHRGWERLSRVPWRLCTPSSLAGALAGQGLLPALASRAGNVIAACLSFPVLQWG